MTEQVSLYFTTSVIHMDNGKPYEGVVHRFDFAAGAYASAREAAEAAWEDFRASKPLLQRFIASNQLPIALQHQEPEGGIYLYDYDGKGWRSGPLDFVLERCDKTQTPSPVRTIFVFGSNLAGRHGAGAALHAKLCYGAVYGQGEGLQGKSYALPTKDRSIQTLPLESVSQHVEKFLEFAKSRPDLTFRVTAIGCGLAGYHPKNIAPMFREAPSNCLLPQEFRHALRLLNESAARPVIR